MLIRALLMPYHLPLPSFAMIKHMGTLTRIVEPMQLLMITVV